MAGKNVTIQDIADRLGMAKSTVSKALSGATDISEKTRERILGCASEMGYQVKTGRTAYSRNLIVFIYGSIHYDKVDQFGYEIILGIQAAAAEQGIGVNIVAINDEELKTGSYYSIMSGGNYEGSGATESLVSFTDVTVTGDPLRLVSLSCTFSVFAAAALNFSTISPSSEDTIS